MFIIKAVPGISQMLIDSVNLKLNWLTSSSKELLKSSDGKLLLKPVVTSKLKLKQHRSQPSTKYCITILYFVKI